MQDNDGHGLNWELAAEGLGYQVEAKKILDRVNLRAKRGTFVGLIGPNGAGKSTLLKSVSGLLKVQAGSVSFEGRDLRKMSTKEIARTLAQVSQTPPYTYGFTAVELAMMGRYPHMGRLEIEGDADRRIVGDAMKLTETDTFADRSLETLSGGERQRVFVAAALAQHPHVLLLDEPTSNLDILHQIKVLEIVQKLVRQGMAAVAAIHDLSLAARYCQSLILMNNGKVLAEGEPADVLTPMLIEAAFGVHALVTRNPITGALNVSVLDQASPTEPVEPRAHVHLICGDGSGARLMFELQRAGLMVTAGPLAGGDTDRAAAEALGIDYVPVTPVGSIGEEARLNHLALVESADIVVLCEMAFGPNNLGALKALASVRRMVVVIEGTPSLDRDFTGGEALSVLGGLNPVARPRGLDEAVECLVDLASKSVEEGQI